MNPYDIIRAMADEAGCQGPPWEGTDWMDDVITDAVGTGPAWAQEPEEIVAGLETGDVATILTVRARFGLGPFSAIIWRWTEGA